MKHSELERLLAAEGQELMRQVYQACLDQRAQAEVNDEVVDAQGKQRTRQRTQRRELETIFGTVEVGRIGYGAEGRSESAPVGRAVEPSRRALLAGGAAQSCAGSVEQLVRRDGGDAESLHRG